MSDAMLLPRATSASEVPGLVKHVPYNPLNSMCELVWGTASRSRPMMCSEVCVCGEQTVWWITIVCYCSSEFRGSFNSSQ